MNFEHLAQYADVFLGLLLIAKLLSLRLHKVYFIFCCLVAADLSGSLIWLARSLHLIPQFAGDYRMLWLFCRLLSWIFTIWTVVLLLNAVLKSYPGVLSISRKCLNYAWIAAGVIGLASAIWELDSNMALARTGWISYAAIFGLVLERAVSTVALVAIVGMFSFLLLFPVRIPRNLVWLSGGFVLYFSTITIWYLGRTLSVHESVRFISTLTVLINAFCYGVWLTFISAHGESVPTQISVRWDHERQESLLRQLDGLNQTLLHAARR